MLSGSFVRDFREPPDEILEKVTHFDVGDMVRVKVHLRKAVKDLPENAAFLQTLDLIRKRNLSRKISRTLPENLVT